MLGLIDLLTRHVWIYICINFYKKLIKVGHLIYRTHLIRSIYAGFHKYNLFLASLLNIFFSPWRRYLRKKRKPGNYNFIAKPIFFKTFKLGLTLSIIKHSSYIYIYIYIYIQTCLVKRSMSPSTDVFYCYFLIFYITFCTLDLKL